MNQSNLFGELVHHWHDLIKSIRCPGETDNEIHCDSMVGDWR